MDLVSQSKQFMEERDTLYRILDRLTKERGFGIPRNYLCYDLETTGLDPRDDLIIELGFCSVVECEPAKQDATLINWLLQEEVPRNWLEYKLEECRSSMKKLDRDYKFNIGMLEREGCDPIETLDIYCDMIEEAAADKTTIVGHNLCFDNRMLKWAAKEWLDRKWKAPDDLIIDTAAIEKALQLHIVPLKRERMADFFSRVLSLSVYGIKYNLERYVVPKYGLDEKYHLDMKKAHSADFDARLCHLLIEEYRTFFEAKPVNV